MSKWSDSIEKIVNAVPQDAWNDPRLETLMLTIITEQIASARQSISDIGIDDLLEINARGGDDCSIVLGGSNG